MRQANRLSIEAVLKIGSHAAGCLKRDVTTPVYCIGRT
jgi:hypothetical protein